MRLTITLTMLGHTLTLDLHGQPTDEQPPPPDSYSVSATAEQSIDGEAINCLGFHHRPSP